MWEGITMIPEPCCECGDTYQPIKRIKCFDPVKQESYVKIICIPCMIKFIRRRYEHAWGY